jgi:hypothetical protein
MGASVLDEQPDAESPVEQVHARVVGLYASTTAV